MRNQKVWVVLSSGFFTIMLGVPIAGQINGISLAMMSGGVVAQSVQATLDRQLSGFAGSDGARAAASNVNIPEVKPQAVSFDREDASSFQTLAQLAQQKGAQDLSLGQICINLQIDNQIHRCRVHQLDYENIPGKIPSFNVLKDPLPGESPIIVINHHGDQSEVYLTSTNQRLTRAIHGEKGDNGWSWTPVSIKQALPGFNAQVKFWLAHQSDVETWPDQTGAKTSESN